jgi:hypothetical protein
MSRTDVFALRNTGLNLFLFAEVGIECNGSMLTVLSVLARLGEDPWAQAAHWVNLPRPDIIDRLAHSIAQMPLPPRALRDARQTATRLSELLPTQVIKLSQTNAATPTALTWPRWAPVAVIVIMLACALGSTLLTAPNTKGAALTPFAQTEPVPTSAPSN